MTTSTFTRKSMTEALSPLLTTNESVAEPFASVRDLVFCDVVRRSAKREEKMFQRCSPSLSRMKSAACGSSFELAFSDLGR